MAFLDGLSRYFVTEFHSASHAQLLQRYLPSAVMPACTGLLSRLTSVYRVPTVLILSGAGISTCCPSTTLLSLALGPDFPRDDQLYPGFLRYSAVRILTLLSLLIPAFSLHNTPLLLTVQFHHVINAPLPTYMTRSHICSLASVVCFSPGNFRRGTSRPVSYYALFECVAASEPTSWLSMKSYILFHLTHTLGP